MKTHLVCQKINWFDKTSQSRTAVKQHNVAFRNPAAGRARAYMTPAVLFAQDEQARTACRTADNRRGANRIGVQQEKRAARLGAGRAKRRRYIYNRGHRAPPCG